jgi:hypothetical protein
MHLNSRLVCALMAGLVAGHVEATCLNRENTSVPESTPTSNHIVHPDGTVTAPATGLMWKRCLEGQALVDDVCEGMPTTYMWPDAFAIAQATSFAGHNDWRLPNPKELLTIFEDRCAAPALNADLFPISGLFGIRTATPATLTADGSYYLTWVLAWDGELGFTSDLMDIPVLLVRDLP